ncbi:MAG: hypothetical protein KY476_01185 [Planctomycetes bacterium]|nr:hypothetical protein [Planctomycetota bacterium]
MFAAPLFQHPSGRICTSALALAALAFTAGPAVAAEAAAERTAAGDRLTVHEWGTFTCLQNEAGRAVRGINTDDEPVPQFVHRLSRDLILQPGELAPAHNIFYKSVPRLHRDIAMRLETPVIYFYPPTSQSAPQTVDVRVAFRGGWLTEYYPKARVEIPGFKEGRFRYGRIAPDTLGALAWNNLTIGVGGDGPATDSRAWLAPRQVAAAGVRTSEGESERFLFYRGVGNVAAPLRVVRDERRSRLVIQEQSNPQFPFRNPLQIPALWLTHIATDGRVAWRRLEPVTLTGRDAQVLSEVPAEFREDSYSAENLPRLRADMRAALITDGLFADEADALLNTWEVGYFKSPGLRLFFLLPHEWTDAVLPLEISAPADVVRTMVGRVELVHPGQRELLREIGEAPASKPDWFFQFAQSRGDNPKLLRDLWEGRLRLKDAGIEPPADYQAYLALGRFRNALVLDELVRRPNARLKQFAEHYGLSHYPVDE